MEPNLECPAQSEDQQSLRLYPNNNDNGSPQDLLACRRDDVFGFRHVHGPGIVLGTNWTHELEIQLWPGKNRARLPAGSAFRCLHEGEWIRFCRRSSGGGEGTEQEQPVYPQAVFVRG